MTPVDCPPDLSAGVTLCHGPLPDRLGTGLQSQVAGFNSRMGFRSVCVVRSYDLDHESKAHRNEATSH